MEGGSEIAFGGGGGGSGLEAVELAGVVVDEEVGAEDGFVSAEDDVRGRDEGEVALEPVELGGEAGGDFHGGGGDEDVVTRLQAREGLLGSGHDVEDGEEVVGGHVAGEDVVLLGRDEIPEVAALEVVERVAGAEVAVVAVEVLGEGVGDDLVHVHGDDGPAAGGQAERGLVGAFEVWGRGLLGLCHSKG